MGQGLLKSRSLWLILLFCLLIINCNKNKKINNENSNLENVNIQNFIPKIIKGKKYRIISSMSKIYENEIYRVKQYDDFTFIIENKIGDDKYCIKYSGGDNIYLSKNIKPAVIFQLNNQEMPTHAFMLRKNTTDNIYNFLKFGYINGKIYKMISNENSEDLLQLKISSLRELFKTFESKKINFNDKIEMPSQFYEIPLWQLSW